MNQNQLSFEEYRAIYADESTLLIQPTTLYRLTGHAAGRYYYVFSPEGEPQFFVSVTTMIRQTMPTSPALIKWIADRGHDEAEQYKFERAAYGTFMHIQIQTLLINRELDLDAMPEQLMEYMRGEGVPMGLFDEWIDDMRRDVLSFAQFMIDYNVRPIGIEMVLASRDGYAGAVDLICKMDVEEKGFYGEVYKSGPQKGQPKETKMVREILGIVDFKSGRKGFWPEHEIQLKAYENLVRENFPHLVDRHFRLFNWAPAEWRTAPSYKLKDQTDSINAPKLQHLIALAQLESSATDRSIVNITGKIVIDRGTSENIEKITLDNLVKRIENERAHKNTTGGLEAEFDSINDDPAHNRED